MIPRSTTDTSHANSNELIADYNTPHLSSSSSKSIGVPFVHTYTPSIRQSLSLIWGSWLCFGHFRVRSQHPFKMLIVILIASNYYVIITVLWQLSEYYYVIITVLWQLSEYYYVIITVLWQLSEYYYVIITVSFVHTYTLRTLLNVVWEKPMDILLCIWLFLILFN
jgi:hypothetical protein